MRSANRNRILTIAGTLALLLGGAPARAQSPDTLHSTLTLEQAIDLARGHNPTYGQALNDEAVAVWQVREAYANLLPSASTNVSLQYQAPGTPLFGLLTSADVGISRTPAYYFSDYYIGLNYQLDGTTLFRVPRARANRKAVAAQVNAAAFTLVTDVTAQYVAALHAQEALSLATEDLARAEENWKLAVARVQVGAASPLDSLQAAVERGRAQVTELRARTLSRTERRRLMEQIGVLMDTDVELTSELAVFEPKWTESELLAAALSANPDLIAQRATASSARAAARSAKTAYLPSLRFSMGWSGFTRKSGDPAGLVSNAESSAASQMAGCEQMNAISAGLSQPLSGYPKDCSKYSFTDEQRQLLLQQNDVFPFNFSTQPLTATMTVSLPLFQGFTRQRQVEEAQATADDARLAASAQELRLRTEVGSSLEELQASYVAVGIERRNRELAREQFRRAQERYRLGAGSYLELQQAKTDVARAEQDALDAVSAFHQALTSLEALVGRRLEAGE